VCTSSEGGRWRDRGRFLTRNKSPQAQEGEQISFHFSNVMEEQLERRIIPFCVVVFGAVADDEDWTSGLKFL
jgi:hypothetical protein